MLVYYHDGVKVVMLLFDQLLLCVSHYGDHYNESCWPHHYHYATVLSLVTSVECYHCLYHSTRFIVRGWTLVYYHTRENFGKGKLANLANGELFAKIFLTNIYRYTENVFSISTDRCLVAKLSSPIAFTCMVRQTFPLPKFSQVQWCVLIIVLI